MDAYILARAGTTLLTLFAPFNSTFSIVQVQPQFYSPHPLLSFLPPFFFLLLNQIIIILIITQKFLIFLFNLSQKRDLLKYRLLIIPLDH